VIAGFPVRIVPDCSAIDVRTHNFCQGLGRQSSHNSFQAWNFRTSPFAGNFHPKAYPESTMKPIRPNRPTSKSKHESHGQLCRASTSLVPHRTGAIHHASFRSNSAAITVSKPRQKQHLPYLIFARKHKIAKEMGAKNHCTPPPPSPCRRKKTCQK